jgi:hypothetical protein
MPGNVSEVVWNWRDGKRRGAGHGDAADLRRAAVVQAAVLAAAGGLLRYGLGHALAAWVVWGLGAASLGLGLLHPPAYRPLHRFGRILGRGVGQLLVHLLLVPFYYLFFFPVAAYLRLRGRDPMHRRFRPPDLTYWIPHRHAAPPGIYERQFLKEDPQARGLHRPVGSLPESAESEQM